MYTTLEHLEHHIKTQKSITKSKNLFRELKMIVIIFVISFVGMLLFTNAQLFFGAKSDSEVINRSTENIKTDNTISSIVQSNEEKMKKVDSIISQYENNFDMVEKTTSPSLEQDLKSNMKVYDFDFNLLPPMDRLIVSKINLDVPLIDSKYKNENDFTQWNFDEELENGVVKYPTTPQPGFEWNTLLFGHTSQEWREKNPYGTVFSRMAELDQWDEVKLIRKWKLYEYKIVEKIIVVPSNVDKQFQKYQSLWEDYVTLMGCYPLWRTDKRMMVTAKRIN
jgi:LPXTG-site transpeptidase (sortase) family protein